METKPLVVTLHGVGAPKAGSTLRPLAKFFGDESGTVYSSSVRILKGIPHVWLESDTVQSPNLMEVNWSDIRHSPQSWYSEMLQIPKLLLGMLHLAERWHGGTRPRRWLLFIYRLFLEISVWGVPYIVYVMLLGSMHTEDSSISGVKPFIAGSTARFIAAVVAFTTLVLVGRLLWRWSRVIGASTIGWSLVYLTTGLACAVNDRAWKWFAKVASDTYVSRHETFPIVVLILLVFCLVSSRNVLNLEQRLTRFMLAYLPFLAISVLGSVLWVVAIPLALKIQSLGGYDDGYATWSRLHAAVLVQHHYDLQLTEYTNLATISIFGTALLAVAALYELRMLTGWQTEQSGRACRNAIKYVVWLVPIGAVALTWVIVRGHLRPDSVQPRNVLTVYKISSLRILPYLPWVFTPMRIVLDVIGDVLFSALPEDDQLSIRHDLLSRVQTAIDYALSTGASRIILFSHSLGTVFGAACLGEARSAVELITSGSPITTLHARFLGFTLDMMNGFRGSPVNWTNYYRFGDYIGGPIKKEGAITSVVNKALRNRGHTGYWSDSSILTFLSGRTRSNALPSCT
jgi:hypothetical protein